MALDRAVRGRCVWSRLDLYGLVNAGRGFAWLTAGWSGRRSRQDLWTHFRFVARNQTEATKTPPGSRTPQSLSPRIYNYGLSALERVVPSTREVVSSGATLAAGIADTLYLPVNSANRCFVSFTTDGSQPRWWHDQACLCIVSGGIKLVLNRATTRGFWQCLGRQILS